MCNRSVPRDAAERRPCVKFTSPRGDITTGRLVAVSDFVASIAQHGRGIVHCWLGGEFSLERLEA